MMGHSYEPDVQTYDAFQDRALWRLKFIWWPKRCELSNRLLWLTFAYQGTATWTGPGEPIDEHRYHEPVEHIIWQLKQ
jgi:hypothetical protein